MGIRSELALGLFVRLLLAFGTAVVVSKTVGWLGDVGRGAQLWTFWAAFAMAAAVLLAGNWRDTHRNTKE